MPRLGIHGALSTNCMPPSAGLNWNQRGMLRTKLTTETSSVQSRTVPRLSLGRSRTTSAPTSGRNVRMLNMGICVKSTSSSLPREDRLHGEVGHQEYGPEDDGRGVHLGAAGL